MTKGTALRGGDRVQRGGESLSTRGDTPARFSEGSRVHYAALYARPGTMHAGFAQFAAFDQDAIHDRAFLAEGKLTMPVLAIGGAKSFGPMMATVMRFAATDVTEAVVPDAGVAVVRAFLDRR